MVEIIGRELDWEVEEAVGSPGDIPQYPDSRKMYFVCVFVYLSLPYPNTLCSEAKWASSLAQAYTISGI